jgi:trehalose-6-phosphatase
MNLIKNYIILRSGRELISLEKLVQMPGIPSITGIERIR